MPSAGSLNLFVVILFSRGILRGPVRPSFPGGFPAPPASVRFFPLFSFPVFLAPQFFAERKPLYHHPELCQQVFSLFRKKFAENIPGVFPFLIIALLIGLLIGLLA